MFGWLAKWRRSPAMPDVHLRGMATADLFISSTFLDMQRERDILSRLVLPRLRESFRGRLDAIREIDLRWGVTQVMSEQEGAVRICLEEVRRSVPLVIGMVGHRIGWRPTLRHLDPGQVAMLNAEPGQSGLTSLEMRYAVRLAQELRLPGPLILMRGEELSAAVNRELTLAGTSIDAEPAELVAADRLKARSLPGAHVREYETYEEFEQLAEAGLRELLAARVAAPDSMLASRPVDPEIDRSDAISALERAAKGRVVLLYVGAGAGSSWISTRWSRQGHAPGLMVDGRHHRWERFTEALGGKVPNISQDPTFTLHSALAVLPTGTRVVFDHYEDAFATPHHADLTLLGSKAPRGIGIVVVARSPRLRLQAQHLGWSCVDLAPISREGIASYLARYLATFGKHLTEKQLTAILGAPWVRRLGSLRLAVDELRRYGRMEQLDTKIAQLVECCEDSDLAAAAMTELAATLPARWALAPQRIVMTLAATHGGLEEDSLLRLAGESGDLLPASIWSAIKLALPSAFITRGPLVDLGNSAVATLARTWLAGDLALGKQVVERLLIELPQLAEGRGTEELPGVTLRIGGVERLADLLSDPLTMHSLLGVGTGFSQSWVELLPATCLHRVIDNWQRALETDAPVGLAESLARIAASRGQHTAAAKLACIEISLHGASPSLRLLTAQVSADRSLLQATVDSLLQSASVTAEDKPKPHEMLQVLSLAADGSVRLGTAATDRLLAHLQSCASISTASLASAHLALSAGQIAFLASRWTEALRRFERAESLARLNGNARVLCSALERVAAVALELRRFRVAADKAEECRDLAYRLGLFNFEALALERLIEGARRRTEWTRAYSLLESYFQRCRDVGVDPARPQTVLEDLERLA